MFLFITFFVEFCEKYIFSLIFGIYNMCLLCNTYTQWCKSARNNSPGGILFFSFSSRHLGQFFSLFVLM